MTGLNVLTTNLKTQIKKTKKGVKYKHKLIEKYPD